MPPKQRRIALMGYRAVGKSSLTVQFVHNQFIESYEPTIANTFSKNVEIEGQEYNLKLVDTAGQDEYSIVPMSYFMNIDGYILVYSVDSKKSFDVVKFVYEKLLYNMIGSIPVVLVGNKSDLAMEREVSTDAGRRIADKWKIRFLEASAKEYQSAASVFKEMVSTIERADIEITERADGNMLSSLGCVLS